MKLYDVPRDTRVRVVEDGWEVNFKHVDGAYSFCLDDDGQVVHLAAWTDVEIVESNEYQPRKAIFSKDE